jgi:hypothetical protein
MPYKRQGRETANDVFFRACGDEKTKVWRKLVEFFSKDVQKVSSRHGVCTFVKSIKDGNEGANDRKSLGGTQDELVELSTDIRDLAETSVVLYACPESLLDLGISIRNISGHSGKDVVDTVSVTIIAIKKE